MKRSFLFLQGVCSPFFARLADQLVSDGHRVHKVNFNGGDAAYWRGRKAWSFRGKVDELEGYLEKKYHSAAITDVILFGDRRPVHRPAIETAVRLGIRVHVYEEGYFRPFWVTLEREGVNGHSLLPRDPDWYRRVGRILPELAEPESFSSPFRIRAFHDVRYHIASALNPLLYPGYRSHSPVAAPIQYIAYGRRFALLPMLRQQDIKEVHFLVGNRIPFYLLPLQLNSDAQIRDHSRFSDMAGVMEYVLESFARNSPPDSRLVIKNHPLDTGLVNYPRIIKALEQRFDIAGRTIYLESGDLNTLLDHANGVVTVNSTVGSQALVQHCPTMALSDPIYNLPGLTFQGTLDDFWSRCQRPDPELLHCFRATVIHTTQVNGGFYCEKGIRLAVRNSLRLLEPDRSPLEELL